MKKTFLIFLLIFLGSPVYAGCADGKSWSIIPGCMDALEDTVEARKAVPGLKEFFKEDFNEVGILTSAIQMVLLEGAPHLRVKEKLVGFILVMDIPTWEKVLYITSINEVM